MMKKENKQNTKYCSLDIYNITLNISMYFDPQGTIFGGKKQSNTVKNKASHFYTQFVWRKRVK